MKKILILTTYDSFFLKDLIQELVNNTQKKIQYDFVFVNDYMNIKNIIIKLLSFGFINSILLFFQNLINKINKKCISQIYKKNIVKINLDKDSGANKFQYDLILSINYPFKISQNYINIAKYGGINHHLGKLPKYAGRYPVAKAILNQEKEITITIHSLSKNFDSGKILFEKKVNISSYKNNFYKIYQTIFNKSMEPLKKTIFLKQKNKFLLKKKYPIKKLNIYKFFLFYLKNIFKNNFY